MAKTHVAHLSTWHPAIDRVSGLFILEQCAALQASGCTVGLVCSRIQGLRDFTWARAARGIPQKFVCFDPVPTFGFRSWNLPGSGRWLAGWQTRMLYSRYLEYVKNYGKPDLIHAHCALESGLAARLIAEDANIPYVVTEHSSEILNGVTDVARAAVARTVYSDANAVIAVSSELADAICDIAPKANTTVISNLVRESVFEMAVERSDGRTDVQIVMISSLIGPKRIDLAIEALAGMPDLVRAKVCVEIIGDGPERSRLEELARSTNVRCIFHGVLSHDRAMARLARADLLVHPSSFETFGIVLAEAAALGIPVVATRCGGPESIVTSQTGVLVPVDDVISMRQSIMAVVTDLRKWRSAKSVIVDSALERFHERIVISRLQEVYDA